MFTLDLRPHKYTHVPHFKMTLVIFDILEHNKMYL